MDAQVVQLLTDAINKVDAKVDKIDEKVDDIRQFKWQITGGTIAVSIIVGTIIQIFIAYLGR